MNQTWFSVANLTVRDTPSGPLEHHWLWSVIGHPTVQLALTEPNDDIDIDWSALLGKNGGDLDSAIVYSQAPKYSAAIMLANVSMLNYLQ